ncbi:hypothetical protein PTKIN_Ptkin15bG0125600 [Pterospermum kingtungense]
MNIDYEESDLDDDEDGDYEDFDDGAMQLRDRIRGIGGVTKETDGLVEEDAKHRDRNGNVHSVLKTVENLTQRKAVKAKGATPFKLQQENLSLEQEESRFSFSSEPNSKELSFRFKSKFVHELKELNEKV